MRWFLILSCLVIACGCAQPVTPFAVDKPPLDPSAYTVTVSTVDELQEAAQDTLNGPRNIVIKGNLDLQGKTVTFPATDNLVRVLGGNRNGNRIICNMEYNGIAMNAFEVNSNFFIIRDLTFSDYNGYGSALKWNADDVKARLFTVDNCQFIDCGNKPFDPALVKYNQCVGAHNKGNAHISVTNCYFRNCVLSSRAWSHCIYADAKTVEITDNIFESSGHPFGLGSYSPNGIVDITRNRVYSPAPVIDKSGQMLPGWISIFQERANFLFWKNIVGTKNSRASVHMPFTFTKTSNVHSDQNIYYMDVMDPNSFGVRYNIGYYTIDEWKAVQDRNSYWY